MAYSDTLLRHVKIHDSGLPLPDDQSVSSPTPSDNLVAFQNENEARSYASEQRDSRLDSRTRSNNRESSAPGLVELADHQVLNGTSGAHVPTYPPSYVQMGGPQDVTNLSAAESSIFNGNHHFYGNNLLAQLSEGSGLSPLSEENNIWGGTAMPAGPSWLVGYDFDLEALNTSVSATMDIAQPLFQHPSQIPFALMESNSESETIPVVEGQRKQRNTEDLVKKGWFSQIKQAENEDILHGGPATRLQTPTAGGEDQYDVGDNFRTRVSLKLDSRTKDEPLPSTKYLVRFIRVPTQFSIAKSHFFLEHVRSDIFQ